MPAFAFTAFAASAFDVGSASQARAGSSVIFVQRPRTKPVPVITGKARTSQKFLVQVDGQEFYGSQVTRATGTLEFAGKATSAQSQQSLAAGSLELAGTVQSSLAAAGQTSASGDMIDVELEILLAIMQAA